MKRAIMLSSIFLLLSIFSANADEEKCSMRDSYAAETVTDYMDSWKNMHLAYKQFKQCSESGGPAEGFSDADAKLMA